MKLKKMKVAVVAALAGVSGLAYQGAIAQQQSEGASAKGLEEITVTALRREQNLQEVPVSIVAITGDGLETRGLDNLEKVSQGIPNVVITGGGGGTGGTTFRMRGIPNVGTYVDNVWQVSTAGFLTQEFVDIDRVEVLRGPQGTMFGRDSTGGAVRIWTKRPTDKVEGSMTVNLGSLERKDMKGSINLPFGDSIRSKWTVASLSRDGYIHNQTTGQNNGDINQQIFRGDVIWDATDKLSFRVNYQNDKSTYTEPRVQDGMYRTYDDPNPNWTKMWIGLPEMYTLVGKDAQGNPVEPFFDPKRQQAGYPGGTVGLWENRSNLTNPNKYDTTQYSIETNWQLPGDIKLTYLAAKVGQDSGSVVDWDNSQYDIVEDINMAKLDMTSHEVQLTGSTKWFDWLGGYYHWNQTTDSRNMRWAALEFVQGKFPTANVFNSPTCNPAGGVPAGYMPCATVYNVFGAGSNFDTIGIAGRDGTAWFGELTFHPFAKTEFIVGARHHTESGYTQSKAAIAGTTAAKPSNPNTYPVGNIYAGNLTGVPTNFEYSKTTPRAVLTYQFADHMNGYISYSEGFTSGGTSVAIISGTRTEFPYKPSTLKNTEIGFRSDLFDRKVRFNATAFRTIWADLQAAGVVYDPVTKLQVPTLLTTNVGEAEAKGVELELTWVPIDDLVLNFAGGWLHTGYTKLPPGQMSGQVPLAGSAFEDAPTKSYSMSAQYTSYFGKSGSLVSRIDYNYQGQFFRQPPFLRISAYAAAGPGHDESGDWSIVNARFTWIPAGQNYEVSVFGTNLTNEYMINSGFFHGIWGFDFATVGRPREYGVSMKYHF